MCILYFALAHPCSGCMVTSYRAVIFLLECGELELDPIFFYTEEILHTNMHEHFCLHRQRYRELSASVLQENLMKPLVV